MKPIKIDTTELSCLSIQALKIKASKYYRDKLSQTSIINKATGINIGFAMSGLRHVLYARTGGKEKFYAVFHLKEMVVNADFVNFKNSSPQDSKDILGYMHLKAKATVEGTIHPYRIVIRIVSNGKFYYDHSVRIKK